MRAHEFSSTITGDDMDAMEKHLEDQMLLENMIRRS